MNITLDIQRVKGNYHCEITGDITTRVSASTLRGIFLVLFNIIARRINGES